MKKSIIFSILIMIVWQVISFSQDKINPPKLDFTSSVLSGVTPDIPGF